MRSQEMIGLPEGQLGPVSLPSRPQQTNAESPSMENIVHDMAVEMLAAECEPFRPIPEDFSSRLESAEAANPQANYYDIFNLSEEQRQSLIDDIRRNNGLVRLFVHPYFSLHEIHNDYVIEDQRRIDQMLRKILSQKRENRPPVIIMEGWNSIEELYKLIRGINEDDIYVAPTFYGTSQPYPSSESLKYNADRFDSGGNWQKLIELFRELGIERIIAGGSYISVNSSQNIRPETSRYGQCLGVAINNLRSAFDVRLSNASNLTRREINAEHDYNSRNEKSERFRDTI